MKSFLSKFIDVNLSKVIMVLLLSGFVDGAIANTATTNQKSNGLIISDHFGRAEQMSLQARQQSVQVIIDAIAQKSHALIHYNELPQELVTVNCNGTELKQILECLLDNKADVVVRYTKICFRKKPGCPQDKGHTQVAEAWILNPRYSIGLDQNNNIPAANQQNYIEQKTDQSFVAQGNGDSAYREDADQSDELVALAQSNDASAREEAVSSLLTEGNINDPNVKTTLENAVRDQDANVRAQAVSSLAHMSGDEAYGAIQEALRDESTDVRLMAVDGIVDDVTLLQQAMNDSDESVRMLAKVKYEALTGVNEVVDNSNGDI
jgi:hypothetical protein